MKLSRRSFLQAVAASPLAPVRLAVPQQTDVRIHDVRHSYEDYVYRAPYKFGGRVVDRVTILNVHCRVTTRNGKTARGFGSMTMGNVWAFPSATMSYDTTLEAMWRSARYDLDAERIACPVRIVWDPDSGSAPRTVRRRGPPLMFLPVALPEGNQRIVEGHPP